MPIVEHSDNAAARESMIALLAAQNHQTQQSPPPQQPQYHAPPPQPRNDLESILAQLAPLLQPAANAGPVPDVYAVNGNGSLSYQVHPRYTQPSYGSYSGGHSGGGSYGRASGSVNGYDRMADQDYRAQLAAQEQQQLEAERAQQQNASNAAAQTADRKNSVPIGGLMNNHCTWFPRVGGASASIKITQGSTSEHWSLEGLTLYATPNGKERG